MVLMGRRMRRMIGIFRAMRLLLLVVGLLHVAHRATTACRMGFVKVNRMIKGNRIFSGGEFIKSLLGW